MMSQPSHIKNHLDMICFLADIAGFNEKRICISGVKWAFLFWRAYKDMKNYTSSEAHHLFCQYLDNKTNNGYDFGEKYPGADFRLAFPNGKVWKNPKDDQYYFYFN